MGDLRVGSVHVAAAIDHDLVHDTTCLTKLFRHEYRIVHIAGHGVVRADDPAHSGVVIGDDILLTANEISQLTVVPEVVFLNCCYLARTARAHAFLAGRAYVVPEDVRTMAPDVLRHRLVLTFQAEAEEISPEQVMERLLAVVPVP